MSFSGADADALMDFLQVQSKIFFHDNYHSGDHITEAVTGSGEAAVTPRSMLLKTQLISGSTSRTNYYSSLYNPRYSRALIRLRLGSMSDVFAFWGFKDTLDAPAWNMTESHAGFMLYQGNLYAVTGDGGSPSANKKQVIVSGIDCTRDLVYEISDYNFRWYSVPYLTSYFDEQVEPSLEKIRFRKWSPTYSCATIQPQNKVHYLLFYIENLVNSNRYMEVKSLTYHEEFSD